MVHNLHWVKCPKHEKIAEKVFLNCWIINDLQSQIVYLTLQKLITLATNHWCKRTGSWRDRPSPLSFFKHGRAWQLGSGAFMRGTLPEPNLREVYIWAHHNHPLSHFNAFKVQGQTRKRFFYICGVFPLLRRCNAGNAVSRMLLKSCCFSCHTPLHHQQPITRQQPWCFVFHSPGEEAGEREQTESSTCQLSI